MRLKKPDQKFLLFCAISMLTGILAGIFLAVKCRTGNKLMLIVAKERGKWLLLLWALGFSTVGRFCIYLFPAVWGVIGTLFLAQAFASMGIAGIGLGLLFQVPQILIYVPLFLWMMEEADKKSRQFAYLRKIGTAGKNNRRYFLCFFVALSVLFLGILTESYAGSGLVQMILRIVY